MATHIPRNFKEIAGFMHAAHDDILDALGRHGITFPDYPTFDRPGNPRGVAAAKAHPMQGILKYHGLADWEWRIAFLPSISVTNDAAYSITLVEFDPDLAEDEAIIGGQRATGRDLERVKHSLNAVRNVAAIKSHARVWSRNVVAGGALRAGKGLGTSASGSAALAMAAIAAAFGADAVQNWRFVSAMSRLLAGSGCRAATGGVSLWMSYPGIAHENSFAVRLDTRGQLASMRLVTVPLDSRIGLKTESAHADAPNSPLFRCWMRNRRDEVLRCIEAVMAGDWLTVAQMAEADSITLHAVTMTGGVEHKLFAWEPENITLFRACDALRAEGVPVYFSTDTGPTTVLLTDAPHAAQVLARIRALGFDAVEGNIAPGAQLVDVESAREALES
ncbi:diphosphomevalonate/mevalonate 3,5-bisphosphate decarboxylase family protein [Candidatus Roseilinea sp. NK_OTU-006]|jgi:diphosphomevalonate decarboxylase|nr:GHMP kinase [Candidatus Roseilinea sp. NK_OTU-006]